MFAATFRSSDPDLALRWGLTIVTLLTGSALAALLALTWWLARWTAALILELLAAWLGVQLLAVPLLDDLVVVDVDLAPEPPELARDLDEAMGLAEPSEIIGDAPPAWQPPEPEPAGKAELVSRQLMLIGALGGESSGLFSILSSNGDNSDVLVGDALGSLFADGMTGSGLGSGLAGSDGGSGLGSLRGTGEAGGLGSLRGSGEGAGLGSLRAIGDGGGLGSRSATGEGGGGSGAGVIGLGSIGSLALLRITHEAAPTAGVTCRATIDPAAPAAGRIRITGCDAIFHDAVTREIRRAGRDDRVGRINVQVRPPAAE